LNIKKDIFFLLKMLDYIIHKLFSLEEIESLAKVEVEVVE